MKNEYLPLLEEYASEAYLAFNQVVPICEWGNSDLAEKYLAKHWISEVEYKAKWKCILGNIFFNRDKGLPELQFNPEYEVIILRGGCLFTEEDFKRLQKCLFSFGEKYFVVVENVFGKHNSGAYFRMKFPVSISWEEMISGNFISSALVDNSMNEYFVFGESGYWGKYAANDAWRPLDLIGFYPKYSSIFRKEFNELMNEFIELEEWIPENYKKYIKA